MPSDLPDFDSEGSCASCGRRADGCCQSSGGPFHCAQCWGDHLDGSGSGTQTQSRAAAFASSCLPTARTRHHWWTEAPATRDWLERTRAALPAQRLAMGFSSDDAEDEHFFTITDQAATCFGRGVGAKKVWPATLRLCRYLHDAALEPGAVVELGAGVGVPGMLLARRGWRVTLTDLPWLLPLTALNVAANFGDDGCDGDGDGGSDQHQARVHRPSVASLRWGNAGEAAALRRSRAPDLVIGADITYFDDDFVPLLEAVRALGAPRAVIAIQHRNNCHEEFARVARGRGWRVAPATAISYRYDPAGRQRDYCCARCSVFALTPPPPLLVLTTEDGGGDDGGGDGGGGGGRTRWRFSDEEEPEEPLEEEEQQQPGEVEQEAAAVDTPTVVEEPPSAAEAPPTIAQASAVEEVAAAAEASSAVEAPADVEAPAEVAAEPPAPSATAESGKSKGQKKAAAKQRKAIAAAATAAAAATDDGRAPQAAGGDDPAPAGAPQPQPQQPQQPRRRGTSLDADAAAAWRDAGGRIEAAEATLKRAALAELRCTDASLHARCAALMDEGRHGGDGGDGDAAAIARDGVAHEKLVELTWDAAAAFLPALGAGRLAGFDAELKLIAAACVAPAPAPAPAAHRARAGKQRAGGGGGGGGGATGPGGASVLDVGCSDGALVPYLQAAGAEPSRYVGIDLSERMLRAARDTHPALPPSAFRRCSFVDPALDRHLAPDGGGGGGDGGGGGGGGDGGGGGGGGRPTFDAVLFNGTLHFLADVPGAIERAAQLLVAADSSAAAGASAAAATAPSAARRPSRIVLAHYSGAANVRHEKQRCPSLVPSTMPTLAELRPLARRLGLRVLPPSALGLPRPDMSDEQVLERFYLVALERG